MSRADVIGVLTKLSVRKPKSNMSEPMKRPSSSSSTTSSTQSTSDVSISSDSKSVETEAEPRLNPSEINLLVKQVRDLFDAKLKLKVQIAGIALKSKITSIKGRDVNSPESLEGVFKAG